MKYRWIWLIAALTLVSVAGCDKKESIDEESGKASQDNLSENKDESPESEPVQTQLSNGTNLKLEYVYEDKKEYAVVTASKDNNEVWNYTTSKHYSGELPAIEYICETSENVLINEDGWVTALNKDTGEKTWCNMEFGGRGITYILEEDDLLYISGKNGPDLCVIDKEGNIVEYFIDCNENGDGVYLIEKKEDRLILEYETGTELTSVIDLNSMLVLEEEESSPGCGELKVSDDLIIKYDKCSENDEYWLEIRVLRGDTKAWEHATKKYTQDEFLNVQFIEGNEDMVLISEIGKVTAFDINTGEILWED